ncbi:MAG TPA: VCBS repeat-containing protein [Thermoanaerobaculia bacterium]
MFSRKVLPFATLALSMLFVVVPQGAAQAAPAGPGEQIAGQEGVPEGGMPRYIRPETPEERRERLGTAQDPGIDPDPDTIHQRFGRSFQIKRFDRYWAEHVDSNPGFVRPFRGVNFSEELYQENDKYVWVWMEVVDREAVRAERLEELHTEISPEARQFLRDIRPDFTPLQPPMSDVRVRFEPASNGLPTSGNFRNSLAVADMNGDGFADLIVPPRRTGDGIPTIYLGDGKGNWKVWDAVVWPEVGLDYGSVVAGDFNKNGKMDLAFGVHLQGVVIMHGDGAGKFEVVAEYRDYPTRRLRLADVNADGWLDVVAISEGPMAGGPAEYGSLRAYINPGRKKGARWTGRNIAEPGQGISGDWLAVGHFNGDKYPDFIGSNVYFNSTRNLFLSQGSKWAPLEGHNMVIPFYSYYGAVTSGRFSSPKQDDAIVTSFRIWPTEVPGDIVPLPALERVVSIDRVSFKGKEPVRTPIMRWKAGEILMGINRGDFNGDGHQDIIFTHTHPREVVLLLGDGTGKFRRATVEGLELSDLPNYDLEVADIDGDGRPDLIIMFAAESGTALSREYGSIEVFLNRGVVTGD